MDASLFLGNALVVSGSLLLLLLLLKKYAWKDIQAILEKRAKKISDDIDEAERAKDKARKLAKMRDDQLRNSRQEASNIIQNAKDSAAQSRQNMIADAEEEVARKKQQAQNDIEQAKAEALASVKGDVADLSLQIATKILNKELTPEGHQDLIDSFVGKLGE
ncbi:F-type H+-transporting ATPase subunit b [Pilibacter termitis]|uniref:ATP synthase subunit b n=1 Tax=Pilibacter termitis TaxID=263852 RepID=A0A1T4R2U7_9ENTE|nr:F0F1 ATP synthase subunit B [Pilibacter termitis]SKA10350.1 F-type H+-transporting ATPase subunit b [Pilibacter termitis]